jgi:hypothetical protein
MHPNSMLVRRDSMEQQNADNNFERLFLQLPKTHAPSTLYASTLTRIAHAQERALRVRFTIYSFLCVLFVALLFPAISYTHSQLTASGFFEYLSFAFSDGGSLFTYWQEFAVTLLEALPILGITLILFALFGLLNALRLLTKNIPSPITRQFA